MFPLEPFVAGDLTCRLAARVPGLNVTTHHRTTFAPVPNDEMSASLSLAQVSVREASGGG